VKMVRGVGIDGFPVPVPSVRMIVI